MSKIGSKSAWGIVLKVIIAVATSIASVIGVSSCVR
ncbi:smalltalk protein [Phocaeicola sp.]